MKTFVLLSNLISLGLASPLSGLLSQFVVSRQPSSTLIPSGCPVNGNFSCQAPGEGSCCFEAPGGLLMQSQFWDTHPSKGPADSWTIHGLWPDHCDLTYDSNCDPSRMYTDIHSLLSDNAADTLSFMDTYWVDLHGDNNQFWAHEWGKHGTCMSTLEPECLPQGSPTGLEAVAYFQTAVKLFKSLPTYDWLAEAGIVPSATTHTLSQLTSALQSAAGVIPALDCTRGVLKGVSWYFHLQGSAIDGNFRLIDAPKAGSCPSRGIKYPPK